MIVLSSYQVEPVLKARIANPKKLVISTDLGLTKDEIEMDASGIHFSSGETLSWGQVEMVYKAEQACFLVTADSIEKIQTFSAETNRFYSLMPTRSAPTMLLSGIPMHRIKDTDPYQDTLNKIKAIGPLKGQILDTATGLGYTAIEASRSAEHVITIELDPAVLTIAKHNPWSQALFNNPKISQIIGDSSEKVVGFNDSSFTAIIHDPPMFSIAGELYSKDFYEQLYRVLKRGGRLFHYIGDLESNSGRRVAKGVARRLQEAGFNDTLYKYDAFGLVTIK